MLEVVEEVAGERTVIGGGEHTDSVVSGSCSSSCLMREL